MEKLYTYCPIKDDNVDTQYSGGDDDDDGENPKKGRKGKKKGGGFQGTVTNEN